MAVINIMANNTGIGEDVEMLEPSLALLWGCKMM